MSPAEDEIIPTMSNCTACYGMLWQW